MSLTSLEDTVREKAKKCNNTHFLIVDGMSNLLDQKVWSCYSSDFQAFGINNWYFRIRTDEANGYLSFYLFTSSNPNVLCSFILSILSQTEEPDRIQPFSNIYFNDGKHLGWGWKMFISHEVLRKRHIVNDKAVFCAEITHVTPKSTVTLNKGTAERVKITEVPRKISRFSWKIDRFSSFTDKSYSSDEFTFGKLRWKLEVHPKGNADGGEHLSLYLVAADYETDSSKPPTTAVYKLRVLDQIKLINNKEQKMGGSRFSYPDASWGFPKFLPLKELYDTSRGFLLKDEIYVGVEFLFVFPHEIL